MVAGVSLLGSGRPSLQCKYCTDQYQKIGSLVEITGRPDFDCRSDDPDSMHYHFIWLFS